MENELKELDRRIFDRRRRGDGTACVLIHGQPGAGKSHLARQYVNKNRKKFDGGIFWINARLKEEVYQAYWNIAQRVVLRDSPHLRLTPDGNQRPFEDIVKTWFAARHDWLIVFDGITVDKEEDAIELQSFIPDSPNSSIIYVSRASNLATKQRLLRPFPIKVHALSEDDARRLLFKELRIKKPTEAEVKSATELVRKMGGLPLAIHAISHRLGNTHEPLIKYDMKSYSADPKVGGTYRAIMDDLVRLGHQGAWNTISIICFYGGHLPVEMIHLGIKALRHSGIEVNSSWDGERPDLDITFAILMRNALIERNEPDDRGSMSASRDSLIEPEPIDMLKMHSVVQNFCCDFLNSAHVLPQWLGYAVDVFCESFRQADVRIKAKPQHGRVSDYREYLVHGKRLLDHSRDYETKKQNLEAIRKKLNPILAKINAEITAREPGSSQESVCGQIYQISIFDRSSSTSDSVASEHEIRTPKHVPAPLMPHESWYGGDLTKVQVETPTSIHSNSPRIVDHSPRAQPPHFLGDEMYDTDRDEPSRPHPRHHIPFDSTARPDVPPTESHDEGWQTVPPSKRVTRGREFQSAPTSSNYGRPRHHRDLGSFRPTPPRADMTGITNVEAVGFFSQPRGERRGNLPGSSDAFNALAAVHHSSPPASRGTRSISQQRSPSRPRTSGSTQPTYAMIAAGEQQQRPVSSQPGGFGFDGAGTPGPYPFVPAPSVLQRGHSPESLRSRSGNVRPSPLAAEFKPRGKITHPTSHETSPYAVPPVYPGSVHNTPEDSPARQYVHASPGSNFSPPQSPHLGSNETNSPFRAISGVNPATLPLEENISITSKRRHPSDFHSPPPPPPSHLLPSPPTHLTPPFHQTQDAYPLSFDPTYYPSPIPPGYASHPMTRDASSRQSHASNSTAAATDPIIYHSNHANMSPRFSPRISGGMDVSPRDRNADGRPLSKSPMFYHAVPVPASGPGSDNQAYALSGTGGWAAPAPPAPAPASFSPSSSVSPTSHYQQGHQEAVGVRVGVGVGGAGSSTGMSRVGSGPGVAIGSPGNMEIAEFGGGGGGGGGVGSGYAGAQVQFGEHAPVLIEEGRGRVREWERRLREREMERGRHGREGSGSGNGSGDRGGSASGSGDRGRSRGRGRGRGAGAGAGGAPYPIGDVMPGKGGDAGMGSAAAAVVGLGLGLEF